MPSLQAVVPNLEVPELQAFHAGLVTVETAEAAGQLVTDLFVAGARARFRLKGDIDDMRDLDVPLLRGANAIMQRVVVGAEATITTPGRTFMGHDQWPAERFTGEIDHVSLRENRFASPSINVVATPATESTWHQQDARWYELNGSHWEHYCGGVRKTLTISEAAIDGLRERYDRLRRGGS